MSAIETARPGPFLHYHLTLAFALFRKEFLLVTSRTLESRKRESGQEGECKGKGFLLRALRFSNEWFTVCLTKSVFLKHSDLDLSGIKVTDVLNSFNIYSSCM